MFHRLHFTFSTHTVYSQSPSSSTTRISTLLFSLSWLLLPFPHQRSPSRRRSLPFRSPNNGRPCSSRSHRNPPIAASPLPPPTIAVPTPNAVAGTPCCTSSPRSPTESMPTRSPLGTPPLTIASASAVATRIGIRIASADISRKSTSKSASFRFSNYTDLNLHLLTCFYRSFCVEHFLGIKRKAEPSSSDTPKKPKS
ncbi:uncharacterized protein LOC114416877 isoform X2 [Glycine soja]|uniref:uncharacterized protein LOC114416877 isoform X2 n=1 Tax=Glycine soja TaxID=3848 RepID=UPI0010398F83|nr:uncharacterized protein LOC114416877 isoform X2 [Glycine soja]